MPWAAKPFLRVLGRAVLLDLWVRAPLELLRGLG